jgi:hypothetical protein
MSSCRKHNREEKAYQVFVKKCEGKGSLGKT